MFTQRLARIILLLGAVAIAAPAQNAVLATDLVKVFDAHNAAIKAQDADKALALRSAAFKKSRRFDKKTDPLLKPMYLAYVADITPASYRVEYAALESDGKKATLGIVAQLPEDGVVKSRILNFAFEKEGGMWKMGEHEFWMVNATELKRPKSTAFQPKTAFTESYEKSGRIVKVEFATNYTLVMLRDNDVESAVFLPAKAALGELKITAADLEAGNKMQFSGSVQKQDELRMWATSADKL